MISNFRHLTNQLNTTNPIVHRTFRVILLFFFSSRRRHTRLQGDWSSDVCSSDLSRPIWNGPVPHWPGSARMVVEAAAPVELSGVHGGADAALSGPPSQTPHQSQIGRASCRERV